MKAKDKLDETTSTERLLDIIRGKGDDAKGDEGKGDEGKAAVVKGSELISRPVTAPRSVTVGIDIGYSYLSLVKAARPRNKWEILEYKRVALPPDIDRGSDAFTSFLSSVVVPFCRGAKKIETWAVLSSLHVDVRLIRIPKVSDKNIEPAVLWTLKRELAINEQDYLLDYEVRGEVSDPEGNDKFNVMCYSAPVDQVERIKKLFSDIGAPLSGASIVPFAIQNIFINKITALAEKETAYLFISNNYSRIDLYSRGKLTITRDIKTGINSMIEMLVEELSNHNGHEGKFSVEEARKLLLSCEEDVSGAVVCDCGLAIKKDEVKKIITPVLERIVRQMERTFEHFTSTLGYDRVEKLYVSSVMPAYKAMQDYFAGQLGIECGMFDPLKEALPASSLNERISFIPAFGMALSDSAYTPNFIYSFRDKKKASYITKFNRAILTVLIAAVLVCSALIVYEWLNVDHKKTELSGLDQQLQKNAPLIHKETLQQMMSASGQKHQKYAELSKRYRGVALIGELSDLTPDNVSLISLKADLAEKAGSGTAVIEGVIHGNQDVPDTILASYVLRLRRSPMFSDVSVATSKIESSKQSAFLTFALNLKMGPGK